MAEVTKEQVKEEADLRREEALADLADEQDIPGYLKDDPRLKECIVAGSWLNHRLRDDLGLTEDIIHSIGMAHGQQSLFGDPYEWAANLFNDAAKGVYAEGGMGLADEINEKHLDLNVLLSPPLEKYVAEVWIALETAKFERDEALAKGGPGEAWGAFAEGWRFAIMRAEGITVGVARKDNAIVKLLPSQLQRIADRLS